MRIEEYCEVQDGGLVLKERLQNFTRKNITSADLSINRQLDMLDRSAASNIPMTIRGESGCGKDRIAEYAHSLLEGKGNKLYRIDCICFPEVQAALELFGTAGGAPGLLKKAAGGSLYIENIDTLSAQTQYQILKYILANKESTRYMICLGGDTDPSLKTQLIQPLQDYFSAMTFVVPPLRARPADILLLTMQRLEFIYEQYRVTRTVSPRIMNEILDYDWPENIRQLNNVIDRMAFMSDSTVMDSSSLLQSCLQVNHHNRRARSNEQDFFPEKTLKELVQEYEIKVIEQYVKRYGSLRKAASALGVSHSVLSSKLTRYHSDMERK